MRSLGHERFAVVGHDRGARVAHRMTLDHPEVVTRLAVLDIVPTLHVYEHVDKALATAYYHWFFFIQPAPVPERLIDGDPIGYLHALLGAWGSGLVGVRAGGARRVRALLRRRRRPARDAGGLPRGRVDRPRARPRRRRPQGRGAHAGRLGRRTAWSADGRRTRSTSGASGPPTCAAPPSTPGTSSWRSARPRRWTCSQGFLAGRAPVGTRGTRRPRGRAARGAGVRPAAGSARAPPGARPPAAPAPRPPNGRRAPPRGRGPPGRAAAAGSSSRTGRAG